MDILQDLRFAARLLVKDRRFTFAAVTALALGIAANNTVFTFINTALYKDLPFDQPRQIVAIGTRDTRGPIADAPGPRRDGLSYRDFQDWRAAAHGIVEMAADSGGTMNVGEDDRVPERFRGTYISSNAFDIVRVRPLQGRGFFDDDERAGAPPVLIIGYQVWQRRYRGDPQVIGRRVRVNDVPATIVGVMPERFNFPGTTEVWMPLTQRPGLAAEPRNARTFGVTGRLADGVSADQARAALDASASRLAREYPETNQNVAATVAKPFEQLRRGTRPFLMTLMAAVAFVLMIACANVANLLLARATSRSREIAIRASLGATRWRIVRQLLIESVLLSALGGVVGAALSVYGVRYFGVAFDAMEVGAPDALTRPYWVDLSMDGRVLLFVMTLCLGTAIIFGLVPALHVSRTDVNDVLKASGRGGGADAQRWTGALVVMELALTLVLLTGAGLLVRSFISHYQSNLVIDTTNVVTGRLALPAQKYPSALEQHAFFDRLDARLTANPAMTSVTLANDIPFTSMGGSGRRLAIEGRVADASHPPAVISYVRVGQRYFETIGLRIVQGRAFNDAGSNVHEAVINQRLATQFFADADPIGQRLRLDGMGVAAAAAPWLTIVGIVQTLPQFGPVAATLESKVYARFAADPAPVPMVSVIVRGHGSAAVTTPLVRDDTRVLDADLPLFAVQTLDAAVARTRFPTQLIGSLFGFLALTALVLTTVGLIALTLHSVRQRTQEIGIRMALGAQAAAVVWLFVRRTVVQLAIGLTLGLAGALAIGRLLTSYLLNVGARDPITIVLVMVLLAGVALAGSILPVRRATRIDPAIALRYE